MQCAWNILCYSVTYTAISVRPTLILKHGVYTYHYSVQLDKWLDDNICIFAYFLIDTKKQAQQLTGWCDI